MKKRNDGWDQFRKRNEDDQYIPDIEDYTFIPDVDDVEDFEFKMNLDESYDCDEPFDFGDITHKAVEDMKRQARDTSDQQRKKAAMPKRPAQSQNTRRQEPDEYDQPPKRKKSRQQDLGDGEKPLPKRSAKKKQILITMYTFLGLFFLMIGYFAYFNIVQGPDLANDGRNLRRAAAASNVIRGKILASDGTILADTQVDSEGNESRNYPYGSVFAHVVGMSAVNKSGLESQAEQLLLSSNQNPITKAINEIKGDKNTGDNLITTLDVKLQQAAYDALGDRMGAVVAIDPSTGKVLAMVSKPDYNPNTLASVYNDVIADSSSKVLLNQATQGAFVPGSIFKTVTALAFMQEDTNYSSYSYYCPGSITLNNVSLKCYNGTAHGTVNLIQSFAVSCNTSFANIGTILDANDFTQTAEQLLFNKSLPTSIPHVKSSFSLSNDDTDWTKGATAIGQGRTTMTPLHAATLASAIANGGIVMEPYLIDSVKNTDGSTVEKYLPVSAGSIMTTSEAAALAEMMESVVTNGNATALNNFSYSVAGKTGTAEVDNSGDNSWFIGYAPADNPKIALCVLIENSTASSSQSSVPVAQQLFSAYLGN